MYLCRTRLAAFSTLSIAACIGLSGCAMRTMPPPGAWPAVPKELNMQPQGMPPNPKRPSPPEMVGATSEPFYIGPGISEISFAIHAPTGPALEHAIPTKVSLNFEHVKSRIRAPDFDVYLNLPPNDPPEKHMDRLAGGLAMFGLQESSTPREGVGGTGKNVSLDITAVFIRLTSQKDWDSHNLRLTFVPGVWDAPVPQVQVGRVSLYFR